MDSRALKIKDLFHMPLQHAYFQHVTAGMLSETGHFARKLVHFFVPTPSENRGFCLETKV